MKSERVLYPDLLRILASFSVVLIHLTSVGIHDYGIGSFTWRVSLAFNSVCHWAVPAFFMISGMMFLDPERLVTTKKIFKKNIPKILISIVVWGFFYSFLDQYIYGGISIRSLLIAVYGIITNNTGYHLWFLYTLLVLYIATPVLRILTAHATKRQLEYALGIWFVFGVCAGHINEFAGEFLKLEYLLPYEVTATTGPLGFYLLGYYLKKYSVPQKCMTILYALTLGCLFGVPVVNIVVSELTNVKCIAALTSQMGICNFIVAVGLFVGASRIQTEKIAEKAQKVMYWMSKYTFGVYVLHVFYVSLLFRILKLDLLGVCTPIMALGLCVLIFALSLLTSWLFSKVPILRKFI